MSILLAVACGGLLALRVNAQSLPGCSDKMMLAKIRMQYEMTESTSANPQSLSDIADVREAAHGAPPPSANQYATDATFVAETRYCEARAALEGGESDALYWRIDHVKDHGESSFRPDHCSARHDVLQDGCAQWRPEK
jgi:hypothetical protein